MRCLFLLLILVLTACEQEKAQQQEPGKMALQPAAFTDLPGWQDDNVVEIVPAFRRTCERVMKEPTQVPFGNIPQAGMNGDWQKICQDFMAFDSSASSATVRTFFEERFQPYTVFAGTSAEGLFTGYYEASLKGSRVKQGNYTHPLYMRPDDLVMVDLGQFREEYKGQRIAGRVEKGMLKPYETRAQIVEGSWPHNDKVLVWVDNAVDAFFVQIQGSGAITLPDKSVMHIGYAGQNGHPYTAIGKELIARGSLTPEHVSMQSIRMWLDLNPKDADEVMNINKSYVFFQELKNGEGPLGGEGVALTAGRSLAIDRSLIPYGMLFWVNIAKPMEGAEDIKRLMIAQDTGGAIRGAVRGDYFWGHGKDAEVKAGHMKSKGRYWMLLPKQEQTATSPAPSR